MRLRARTVKLPVGAVVSVKVTMFDRNAGNSLNVTGVAAKTTDTGAAIVMTEHGVLSQGKSAKNLRPLYVPATNYAVLDKNYTLTPELHEKKVKLLTGQLDYRQEKLISLKKAQELQHRISPQTGAASPSPFTRCSCQKLCVKNCGCHRKGASCTKHCYWKGRCGPR